jgi:hypothetical protein
MEGPGVDSGPDGMIQLGSQEKNEQESDEDENLLTIDESMDQQDADNNAPAKQGSEGENKPVDEMFLVNQTKNQSITRCMRMLRFL